MQIARGVIGAVVTGHYPLNHHPARLAMEHLEQFAFGWRRISRAFSAAQSVLFVVSTIAVAVVVRACPTWAELAWCLDWQGGSFPAHAKQRKHIAHCLPAV
jgi:hypothetical protein